MASARALLDAVLTLPVTIEAVTTAQLLLPGAMGRITTIVELHGDGHTGRGEDVAYAADTQALLPDAFAALGSTITGTWTIESLSDVLEAHPLRVPQGSMGDDKPGFHRWALESAALDLALRQAGTDLAALVGATWKPVRVSVSMGLGDPPSAAIVHHWLERDPSMTFKLDSARSWSEALVTELAATGAVSTVDFKGLYTGDWIDTSPDPVLYEAVSRRLPDALLEDAKLSPEHLDALDEDALARLAWDYPITKPADIPGLPGSTATFSDLRPKAINIKPSRFGSLERLFGTIALCEQEGIPCYAGGQFELGLGRTQVQSIASLCFADAPNDCAPVLFHGATPDSDVPLGPVEIPAGVGFGWEAPTPALTHIA
ncbi:MAG: hypothetical protein JWM90_764 [Thermoleophilia bacterium]|nr:hypothetical protein [Thermoleophilia bacterium]